MMDYVLALRQRLDQRSHASLDFDMELRSLLAAAWMSFSGSDATSMAPRKIGRAQSVRWSPPILSFQIERHGSTVMGSKNAEIQEWLLNLDAMVASHHVVGLRRVVAYDKPMNMADVIKPILQAVRASVPVDGITYIDADSFRVSASTFVPDNGAAKATLQGRRKRFWSELEKELAVDGYILCARSRGLFKKHSQASSKE